MLGVYVCVISFTHSFILITKQRGPWTNVLKNIAHLCCCGFPFSSTELQVPTPVCSMDTRWKLTSVTVTHTEKKS